VPLSLTLNAFVAAAYGNDVRVHIVSGASAKRRFRVSYTRSHTSAARWVLSSKFMHHQPANVWTLVPGRWWA
jgi:hypothetical protein